MCINEFDGEKATATPNTDGLENDFYKIAINSNGTLTILDKKSNIAYNDVLMIEDGADDGDEYDFSPLKDDFIVTSKDVKANIDIKSFSNKTVFTISYDMVIPKDLYERKANLINFFFIINLFYFIVS